MISEKLATVIDGAGIDGEGAGNPNIHDQAFGLSVNTPVKPVQYSLDDKIQSNCHQDIACFNKCCKNIETQLTPYDILRLKNILIFA